MGRAKNIPERDVLLLPFQARWVNDPARLKIIANDDWLAPFENAINGRHQAAINKVKELTGGRHSLSDFADGYLYFGLHKEKKEWVFREWAPNATKIYLIGDFNNWTEDERFRLQRIDGTGNWEIKLPLRTLKHKALYKMKVYWDGGCGERIPAWCQRVVQDEETKVFCAQVWSPRQKYTFHQPVFRPKKDPLLIYECHIGMAQDAEKVGTYKEFRENILPRIKRDGYNCIQIMAIQEHPYYGSFGYHVSSFFAPSSRFGTPEELKALIDEAHAMGLAVIMDLVHSHAVKNEVEGLGNLAGDPCQYFYSGGRREHPAWDSLCFDYGKNEVIHFLLSNCKYWLEEYHFDGFRFDGVTSMLYYSHGLGEAFTNYADYYNGHQDDNAICYLTLANLLIHEVNKNAITIAEGEKEAAILNADAVKEQRIREAQGEAEALLTVQRAKAEGIRMINEADPTSKYLAIRSFEAAEKMADGQATKLVVPSDIADLAGTLKALKETVVE